LWGVRVIAAVEFICGEIKLLQSSWIYWVWRDQVIAEQLDLLGVERSSYCRAAGFIGEEAKLLQ
jgi:hypothetical protein